MKNLTFLGIFCLALIFNCNGQLDSYLINMQSEYNFYQIKEEMEIYLDSLIGVMDSSEYYAGDGEFKNFKKFVKMWEPRVTPHGEFMKYFEEEENFYLNLRDTYEYVTEGTWNELGPKVVQNSIAKGIGPMEFITFFDDGTTQSTQYMLAGSLHSGLFYSTNYGETWNKTGTDTEWAQSGCSWAVFHTTDHTKWYASTSGNPTDGRSLWIGKTGGIFRITNEGQDFHQIADKDNLQGEYTIIYKLIIDPADSLVLYASTNKGIFKTTNCEAQDPVWENKLSGLIWDMELKPGNSSVLYASQFNDEDSLWQIKRSQDYGETWLALQNQPDLLTSKDIKKQYFTIEVSKAKPDFIYCISRNGTNSFYYIDLATSNNWIPCGSNYNGFGNGHGFGVEQIGNVENIVVSNGTILTKYDISTGIPNNLYPVHVDVEDIIYHPYNIDEIWICTHGGVEKSPDGGIHWLPKYDGLGVAQVEKMATSYTDPKFIIGGLYHDGVQITKSLYELNWNPTWNIIEGFLVDGMKPLINNKDPRHMWGSGQWGMWKYSSDYFNNSQNISENFTAFWQSIGVLNKQDPSIFFRNKFLNSDPKEEVYRSTDYGMSGGTQVYISEFGTQFPLSIENLILGMYTPYTDGKYLITILREKDANADFIWHLFLTKNANDPVNDVVWEELSIPRSNSGIAGIEFDPDNPDIIFLTYSRSSNENILPAIEMIYKIDYTDPASPVFTDITKNLPFTSARGDAIAVERGGDGGVYLATEFGVFFTNNEMQSNTGNEWQLVGKNLPHVPINGIELNYISNTLRVGTWGRGFWELPLPCLNDNQPLILSDNTQWDSYRRLDRSVVVNAGATLTITQDARISMPSESKIIVAPGAKLIVDGGTITNACPGTWNGVEIWGDNTAHQYPDEHGNFQQGYMELKNGATIENAINGVLVGELLPDGTWNLDKAGGIIRVIGNYSLTESSAKFLNNKWAITYLPYENFHPFTLNKMSNLSYFNNALFEVNNQYPGTPLG